jgi:NosR/NirI family transcriptional regulator, nitrous oxide reductase regulator
MRSLPVVSLSNSSDAGRPHDGPTPPHRVRRSHWFRSAICHGLRIALLGLLLLGLHRHARSAIRSQSDGMQVWQAIDIAKHLPKAHSLQDSADVPELRIVVDQQAEPVAVLATSSPIANHIIGYSGPTQLLLIMDEANAVQAVKVLKSFDTPEHLQQVVQKDRFWSQFTGWKWGQQDFPQIDGVSGATLTSLAIAESVVATLASGSDSGAESKSAPKLRSLKFPDELTVKEVEAWLLPSDLASDKQSAAGLPDSIGMLDIRDANHELRRVFRTGPLTDDISGYQGPTELLLGIDQDNKLIDARIRSSFDNEPYVRYTKQERSFWKKFKGRSLQELSTLDLKAEKIDGVSGATMTSLAVAETLREAANHVLLQREKQQPPTPMEPQSKSSPQRKWNFSVGEIATILISLLVIPWSASKLRGERWLRLSWQLICFITIAFVSGNLISIALLSGWTRGGLSYRLAPGLTTLLIVAFGMAIFAKRNVYCDHVCPHGILQQWVRPRRKDMAGGLGRGLQDLLKSKITSRLLAASSALVIMLGVATLVFPLNVNLAWLEPFDAYVLGIGVSLSSLVAVISLVASRVSPMHYCRTACPTGKVFDYVRRDPKGNELRIADLVLAAACLGIWWIQ